MNSIFGSIFHRQSVCIFDAQSMLSQYMHKITLLLLYFLWDAHLVRRFTTQTCGTQQCFNTSAMGDFTAAMIQTIRSVDSTRPISSGFAAPRPSAFHQAHCSLDSTSLRQVLFLQCLSKHAHSPDYGFAIDLAALKMLAAAEAFLLDRATGLLIRRINGCPN